MSQKLSEAVRNNTGRNALDSAHAWPTDRANAYIKAGYWTGETLEEMLQSRALVHPNRTVLTDAQRSVTYAELHRQGQSLAAGLLATGLRSGDCVILQVPNRIELFELLFALASLGVVPVLALPAHRQFELTSFARLTEAVAIVTVQSHLGFDYASLAVQVAGAAPSVQKVLIVEPPDVDQQPLPANHSALGAVNIVTTIPRLTPVEHFGPDASQTLLFQLSGGSTGTPKLIARTHNDYLYSVRASVAACEWNDETVYLAALPAQHNFPLSSPGVLGAMEAQGRAVLSDSPAPMVAFDWIQREQVTCTALVPSLVRVWIEAAKKGRTALASLQLLQVGGAPFAPDQARLVRAELGCTLQQVFGMAEGLVCYTRLSDSSAQIESCQGRPMSPGDELLIVDDDDKPVALGQEGELLTRGPYTLCAYFRDETEHASRFTSDGFYRTGDRVRMLASGDLVVVGRSKDQINRGGDKIACAEIETHLLAHPLILDAAVVGIDDKYLGQRSRAFLVASPIPPSPADLRRFIRDRGIAAYKIPDSFQFLPALPRTGVGKVDKKALRTTL